jgi:phage gp29-like protein
MSTKILVLDAICSIGQKAAGVLPRSQRFAAQRASNLFFGVQKGNLLS